jgi:hypothetical protein
MFINKLTCLFLSSLSSIVIYLSVKPRVSSWQVFRLGRLQPYSQTLDSAKKAFRSSLLGALVNDDCKKFNNIGPCRVSEKHSSLLCKSVDYTKKGFILLHPENSFLSSNEYDLNRGGNSQNFLRSSYDHLTIILRSSYDHLMIISRSSYDHLTIILWSSYDHLMIILRSSYNHLTIILRLKFYYWYLNTNS